MSNRALFLFICGLFLSRCLLEPISRAQPQEAPLRLVATIAMPNVKGRLDHMDIDVKGQRLFVAGLENGSVEVVDLKAEKWLQSIPGFKKPQGIIYVESLDKLFVASGGDSMVQVFRGRTLDHLASISLGPGPNRLAYDSQKRLLYAGYDGKDAGQTQGQIAVIDAKRDLHLTDIVVDGHPAELLLTKNGKTLYVFLPVAGKVQVIDTRKRQQRASWPVSSERPGDAALDGSERRLVIGTRKPAEMVVMDSSSGREVAALPTVEGMDGVYFDSVRRRIYVSGGRGLEAGSVFVYQQKDAGHYEYLGMIATRPGAGTSFWSPQLHRYFVAAPAYKDHDAAILVFEPAP